MNEVLPYTPVMLTKLAVDAKLCVQEGRVDELVTMSRDLLPWAGSVEVDRALGKILRLLLRDAKAACLTQIETEAFSLQRLQQGWNPQDASVAYLNWKYRQAFRPGFDPDLGQVKAFAAAAQALWSHVDEPTRLTHGLYVKRATAHGALGDVGALRDLAQDVLARSLTHEGQQAGLLRIIKQLQRLGAGPEIEVLLGQMLSPPEHISERVEAALIAVAALQTLAKRLSDYERFGPLLRQVVNYLESCGCGLCDSRLVNALLRCGAFDQLHRLLPHLLANVEDVDAKPTLLLVIEQLQRYDVLGNAGQYIERVYQADAGDPLAVLVLARYLATQGVPSAAIEQLFEAIRPDAAYYDDAVLWRAQYHYHLVEHAKLLQWLNLHPLNHPEKARLLLNRVHAARERQPFPAIVSEADSERLSLKALSPLDQELTPLVKVINGDLYPAVNPPLNEFRKDLQNVELTISKALESSTDVAVSSYLTIGRELFRVAGKFDYVAVKGLRRENLDLKEWDGPQTERVRLIYETLHRIAMQLSKHVIQAALKDSLISDVRQLCQAADIHLCSSFAVGEPQASKTLLQELCARQIALPLMLQLLERCALQRGDLHAARQLMFGQVNMAGEMYGLEPFNAWLRMEGTNSHILVEQEPRIRIFEYINPQGVTHWASHEVPGTHVEFVQVQDLRIRDIELLVGSRGTIARPHSTHGRDLYGYPRESPVRLNYGCRGCRLGRAKDKIRVQEPVIVLGNMDGPYMRNYYHWMLLILTRVAVLLDHGLFEHRRLLVPAELSEWMMTSLKLVGLPEERMLRYRGDQEVLVDDAWVVGSVEWAAAALMKPLQRRLWTASGIDPQKIGTRAVWLSRRDEPQRYLANTDAFEDLARQMGFYVVNPGTLTLLDQVRLCAGARIIAGPEGSSFTNLLFARPGTQVLTLMVAGGDYETWLDMCVMGDLPQRWIFGHADPRKAWWAFHHEPYEIDLHIVERELRRLMAEVP